MEVKLEESMSRLAQVLAPKEDIQRARRVDRGLDSQGRPILTGRTFFELEDSDGSGRVWRIRVRNGALEINQVTS